MIRHADELADVVQQGSNFQEGAALGIEFVT